MIDLSISAYDSSVGLPSTESRLVSIRPSTSAWAVRVHLACQDPPNSTSILTNSLPLKQPKKLPTIIYEPSSGIPGSIALLDSVLPPSSVNATNPGRWLFDLQEQGEVGRVCVWDRPGYGFSEVLGSADLGLVADSLWLALEAAGEVDIAKKGHGFLLAGEGYGG